MRLLRSAGMPWKKNARRAISAVLAMTMAISAAGFLEAPKLKASGEHQITISATTYSQGGFFIEEKLGATGPVDIAGGTVELTKYTAEAGEIISVLANPKTTFQVEFVLVGNGVTGTDISKLDAMEFEMPDEDVMVDVKFKAIQDYDYTVYFDTLDGYGSMPARIFPDETSASAFTLPAPTFDCPDNKIFAGWVIPEDETVYGIGAAIPVPKEGLVCFAKYIDFSTKAIFTAGDHGTGTMDPITFTSRAEAAAWRLPECGFDAEDGYCFDCWDVLGTEFKSGDPFSMDLQVEYFAFEAKWKPLEDSCYVVAAGALNVREDASLESDRVGGLTYGKAFDATSEKITNGEKWVRLKYNGDDGVMDAYVMRKYLYLTYSVDTAIKPQKVTVNVNSLTIRSAPDKSDDANRISGVTNGKELLVTGYLDNGTPDDTTDDWLVLDYEMPDGTHRLAFAMSKYTEGLAAKLDIGTKSLKISGSIPTGYSLDPSAVVASDDTADISAENFGNEENGLYTAIIYPADGHNFSELKKSDITLAEDFDLSVMDFALNDDGSVFLTLGPVDPVKISFVGSDAAELLAKYVSEGKTVVKPAEDPTLDGSTFTGWYEDEACTIEFDFSKPITGDISLYAGFQPNEPKSTEAQQQGGENTNTNTDTDEPQSQVSYTATCENGKVIRGSGKPFVVTVKRSVDDAELCFQMFRNAYIDGKPLVKDQNYTAEKGSTIITIKSEALDALADGTHTITIEFADGKAEYTFTLAQPDAQTNANTDTQTNANTNAQTTTTPAANNAKPKTGDVGSNTRIVAIIAVAMVGIAAVLLMDKRKKDEDE